MNTPVEAYILKTIDYKETSKLIYLYTPKGKQSAIARGVKKLLSPWRHLTQTGSLILIELGQGALPTLKEAQTLRHYTNIKTDLIKQTICGVIQELLFYNLTDNENHEKLFNFLKKWLDALDHTLHPLELLMVFELKFLYFLGYGIDFARCSVCNATAELMFDPQTALVTCAKHTEARHRSLDQTAYAPLKYYLHLDILHFEPLALPSERTKAMMAIIDGLYAHYLSATPKAKRILHTLL